MKYDKSEHRANVTEDSHLLQMYFGVATES